MLTKKQKELYDYLKNYISSNEISPSFEEMKSAVNLKSKSGIHRLITSLEERGFIKRLKHKARAMEIINKNNITDENSLSNSINIPLIGAIAAGEAIEAIEASMSAKEFRGYLKGAILKYIWRYTYKDRALEDLLKARWYLDKLISDVRLESDLKNEIKLND